MKRKLAKQQKITAPQLAALRACHEGHGLFRNVSNGWRWYRRHERGHVSIAAGNATAEVLLSLELVEKAGALRLHITSKGLTFLKNTVRKNAV